MKRLLIYLFLLFPIVFFEHAIYSQTQSIRTSSEIIKNEQKMEYARELKDIVDSIDSIYTRAFENIRKGSKLVIFITPAHGRLQNGEWHGGWATDRASSTYIPEEFYSIPFSRKLFDLLKANPNIRIETTKDYLDVLNRKTTEYKRISFSDAVILANEKNAFIMISQHLNNVGLHQKAGGSKNISGIHILKDSKGNYYLGSIRGSAVGFLTLYNRFDAGGFSKHYSDLLRDRLVKKGIRANGWGNGSVADDRFMYFRDFPVSVIYESGFISNPAEEKKLADPAYQDSIVREQYDALLESIKNFWGFDISGKKPKLIKEVPANVIEMMKLSRMVIYYLKKTETQKAVRVIDEMLKHDAKKFAEEIKFYSSIKTKILEAEDHHKKYIELTAKKRHREALASYRKSLNIVNKQIIFAFYVDKFSKPKPTREALAGEKKPARAEPKTEAEIFARNDKPAPKFTSPTITRAPLEREIILVVRKGDSLEKSINDALSPSPDMLRKLTTSFNDARITTTTTRTVKGERKTIKETKKVSFAQEGIYIVKLDKNLRVVKAHTVKRVFLNPSKYQNQLYLKNSHFANNKKEKTL